MPSMADITVKASNGTTDVVYNAVSPSAGDKIPSVWKCNAASVVPQHRQQFALSFRDNADKNARNFTATFNMPIVQTVGGVATIVAKVPISATGTLPSNVDATLVKEAYYQFGNLFVAALIRSCFDAGYAAQ